jgi:hypothetical protein
LSVRSLQSTSDSLNADNPAGQPMATITKNRFRVELRTANSIKCIATDLACDGHRSSLDPFVSRLMLERTSGLLLLIEPGSGQVVAKRKILDPFEHQRVKRASGW